MTVIAVTGSRPPTNGYRPLELNAARQAMRFCWQPGDTLVTGGALGIDAEAMAWGFADGLHVVTLLPASDRFTDQQAVAIYSHEVIHTGAGYWRRDRMEVERADRVLALPLYERYRSSRYSGTWHTWDVALDQGKDWLLVVTRPAPGAPTYIRGRHAREYRDAFPAQSVTLL